MTRYDLLVIGSGPAGQKAAVQGAKAGARVALVERNRRAGGECVQRGTIPSKTLRAAAHRLADLAELAPLLAVQRREDVEIAALLTRLDRVVRSHEEFIDDQLRRNGIDVIHGRASFASAHTLDITHVDGSKSTVEAEKIIIASGSRPRSPESIPVDHERVLDSDSILSMTYVPASLVVLGAGVIGSEYASIFSLLGTKVTLLDRAPLPLGFLHQDLSRTFVEQFEARGGKYLGSKQVTGVTWDGVSKVVTCLESGETLESDKVLVSMGRVANLKGLAVEQAGLAATERGLLEVDEHCRTKVPHIYAVGDVIGPPGLASTAMEQGRRAARHALSLEASEFPEVIPMGIYTLPEISTVGMNEDEAEKAGRETIVGRALFSEIARGQISGHTAGLLKIVSCERGRELLGFQIVGEGATELIHIGQMALMNRCPVDIFVEKIFNFPTLAEAYRVAALDIVNRRPGTAASSGEVPVLG